MRLICPNCDAQYEVPDDAIPPAGRDVQCSGCGHAWFQPPPAEELAAAEEAALFGDDIPAPPPVSGSAPETPFPEGPAPAAGPASAAFPDDDDEGDDASPAAPSPSASPAAAPAPAARALDESLMAVLREEAEREAAARRAEAARPIETQPDLGLAAPVLSPTQRRLAMLKGQNPDAPPPEPPAPLRPAARRDLLPDVEEINSTLRSTSAPRAAEDEEDGQPAAPDAAVRSGGGGFRSGFTLMVGLSVLVVVAYMLAPRLAEQFPAAGPALQQFVAFVDGLRLWLDGMMEAATNALNGQA